MENIIESTVNAEPVVNVEPQQIETVIEPKSEPVETNNVEVVEPQQEPVKPVQSAEDNAKFAAIRREAEQRAYVKAQDELIASMYGESHGIYTKADYDKAVIEAQEEQRKATLREQGIDPSIIDEYVNNNPTVQQAQKLIKEQQQRERQQQDFQEFLNTYPNVKAADIPAQVWEEVNKGTPLKIAYGLHENSILKAKLAEYEKGSKTQEINNKNALTSTGSTVGNGSSPSDFIAKEVFEANKSNHEWMNQNYDLLMKSMNKWK